MFRRHDAFKKSIDRLRRYVDPKHEHYDEGYELMVKSMNDTLANYIR